jgi:hypothetical protein
MKLRKLAVVAALTFGLLAACGPDDNPSGNPGSDGNNTATTSSGNNTATTSSGGGYN